MMDEQRRPVLDYDAPIRRRFLWPRDLAMWIIVSVFVLGMLFLFLWIFSVGQPVPTFEGIS